MPKKSKKQKMLAFQHYQAKILHSPQNIHSQVAPMQQSIPSGQTVQTISITSVNNEDVHIAHYFKVDLKKSLLLIVGIIALELFFYFVSMNTDWIKLFKF